MMSESKVWSVPVCDTCRCVRAKFRFGSQHLFLGHIFGAQNTLGMTHNANNKTGPFPRDRRLQTSEHNELHTR